MVVEKFIYLVKKLDSGWEFSEEIFGFPYPIPKIKFDPLTQGKNALVFIFQVLH